MDLGLKGKVALVAAASKGLGFAIARELAMEGASVVMCARQRDTIDAAAKAIGDESKSPVLAVVADVAKAADLDRLRDEAFARFGRVDVLVTNGGGPPPGRFEALTPAHWQAAAEGTLFSAIELARRVLPGMRERRWGRVLNVTSISVKQPVENLMLSNSLRAAVTGWARTLANEVASDGVTVNCMLPGFTRTERMDELSRANAAKENVTPAEILARWEHEIPMRRLGEPREFAALAAFLASERASYISGQSIAVDGGWIQSIV